MSQKKRDAKDALPGGHQQPLSIQKGMIREYASRHKAQVERCLIKLQDFEKSLEPDRRDGAKIASGYLQHLLRQCDTKNGKIFIAEIDGRVAGLINVWTEEEPEASISSLEKCAYISDLVVLSQHQGQGIGKSLVAQAEHYAAQIGAGALKVDVLIRNSSARKFYINNGFRDYELCLLKPLDLNGAKSSKDLTKDTF